MSHNPYNIAGTLVWRETYDDAMILMKKSLAIQYHRYTSMEQNFSTTEFTNGQIIVGLSSVTLFSRFVQNGDNDDMKASTINTILVMLMMMLIMLLLTLVIPAGCMVARCLLTSQSMTLTFEEPISMSLV